MDNWKEYQTEQIRKIAQRVAKEKSISNQEWIEGFIVGYKVAHTWNEY